MNYQEALREWGARRLQCAVPGAAPVDRDTVEVAFEFEGAHWYSELTMDEAKARVRISGLSGIGVSVSTDISTDEFDFAAVLGEIVQAGGGTLDDGEGSA
jgi:hypothetical protein